MDVDARMKRQLEDIRGLARRLVEATETLAAHLPELCRLPGVTGLGGIPQRRTSDFGSAIAEMGGSPS